MYESMTYEKILDDMLSNVPDDYDKREGSPIYVALAPCAAQLAQAYVDIDVAVNETNEDTASRENLVRIAKRKSITPYAATYCIANLTTDAECILGDRFQSGEYVFYITEILTTTTYRMTAMVAGTGPNSCYGKVTCLEGITGLTSCEITSIYSYGEDEEDTESFRERYLKSLEVQPFAGNREAYIQLVDEMDGVGATKIKRATTGGNVPIYILSSDYSTPSAALATNIQNTLDPDGKKGMGYGLAPIGHNVTVTPAQSVTVNITATITYDTGLTWDELGETIKIKIDSYLLGLRKSWEDSEYLVVRISHIESAILNVEGVIDITGTQINSAESNLTLEENQIPVRGTINGN